MTSFSYQLYSSRNFPPLSDTLHMIKAAGYGSVEGYGALYEGLDTEAVSNLRSMLDDHGLAMPTGHFGMEWLERDLAGALQTAKRLGVSVVIVPFIMPEHRPTDSNGWRAYGARLATLGDQIAAQGFDFAYHNHEFEFVALPDGNVPMELILQAGDGIKWEADLAWVVRGGADPLDWLARYGDKVICTHVKDIAAAGTCLDEDGWADVGHGTMDWATLFDRASAAGCTQFVAEHDNPKDHTRFAERSIATMKKLEGNT